MARGRRKFSGVTKKNTFLRGKNRHSEKKSSRSSRKRDHSHVRSSENVYSEDNEKERKKIRNDNFKKKNVIEEESSSSSEEDLDGFKQLLSTFSSVKSSKGAVESDDSDDLSEDDTNPSDGGDNEPRQIEDVDSDENSGDGISGHEDISTDAEEPQNKLYADFYSADIIVASPLGLRVTIGAEGEAGRDYDFLSSIEVLVLDQMDVFYMQNWDHLLHVLDHLHLQPQETHGTDFSRVRSWAVNGWTRFYRQTVLLSSIVLPEFNSIFNKKCHNYAGKVRVVKNISNGSICQIIVQLPQVFQRMNVDTPSKVMDARFDFLIKKVLPQYKDSLMNHTLIYIPSYFDYVRVRNYFKREDLSFVQLCEYSKENKIARARDMFFHGDSHFLLYSERFHFFRRLRIKGIRHIVFYQPPTYPHFYSELCNLMQEANQSRHGGNESNMTVTTLYSKFDAQQLAAIVGTNRATRMLTSERDVHMFVTGE